MKTFRRKVKKGSQTGRKIGFPTLNFNVGSFADHYSPGVYACHVQIDKKDYRGALYFGPKMNHCGNCLEIYILNFTRQIYGKWASIQIGKKIRGPKKVSDLKSLQKIIKQDVKKIV